MLLFDVEDFDLAAEGGDDVEQRGAGGVHADGVQNEVGVWEEERGAEEEGGGGEVAGNGGVDGFERLAPGDAELVADTVEGGTEGAEGVLGVVAGADGLGEAGGAVGLEAGEEDGGLDLRAGDGGVEVDGVERAADDGDRGVTALRSVAAGEVDLCAHGGERLADALHRTEGEGVVADEGEVVRMGGDEASQHAHGGAGVSAVERVLGLDEVAGGAGDFDGLVLLVRDGSAECGHAGEGGVGVCAGGEVREAGGAFGEAGEHGVTVRDGLVAG